MTSSIYNKMNITIGKFGSILYVHRTVPGVIAMSGSRSEPRKTVYGMKEDTLEVFEQYKLSLTLMERYWAANYLGLHWGWKDAYFGAPCYQFLWNSPSDKFTSVDSSVYEHFKEIEQAWLVVQHIAAREDT